MIDFEISEKALDRVDKILQKKRDFIHCLKNKVCPKCGDGDLKTTLLKNEKEVGRLCLEYKCDCCDFVWIKK